FIPVLAHARGFKVDEVAVNHRARKHGVSKYGFNRFMRGFLDLITVTFLTGYGQRPQYMQGAIGVVPFGLCVLGLAYLAMSWTFMHVIPIFKSQPIGPRPLLTYSILSTLLGSQAMSLGLLAELIVHYTSRDTDMYAISDEIGSAKSPEAVTE